MQQTVTIIAPTLFAIALGYLFGRFSRSGVASLVNLGLYVATPCLVFYAMYTSTYELNGAVRMWGSSVLIMAGSFLAAWIVFGLIWRKHQVLYLPITFQNTINIPLPIIALAFPDSGVAQLMLFYIPYSILVNTLGVYMGSGRKGLKEGVMVILHTPLIYAVVLALTFNLTGVVLPKVITNSLDLVGGAAVPLMLIVLGMTMGGLRFTQLPATLVASVLRIAGGFGLGLLAVWLFGLTGVSRAVVIFEAAMPSAVFCTILASRYENEAELVSSVVLATTIISIVTVPLLIFYLT